jgi:hypothetical protein
VFARKKFQRPVNFYFSRIKKSSGGGDSATGQCERAFNKLARTFAAQVEKLSRLNGVWRRVCGGIASRLSPSVGLLALDDP